MLTFRKGSNIAIPPFEGIEGTICATFYAFFVKIGPLTPKISQRVSVHFRTRWQKLTYHTKYLSKYWTKLRQLFSIGRVMYADYKAEIMQ